MRSTVRREALTVAATDERRAGPLVAARSARREQCSGCVHVVSGFPPHRRLPSRRFQQPQSPQPSRRRTGGLHIDGVREPCRGATWASSDSAASSRRAALSATRSSRSTVSGFPSRAARAAACNTDETRAGVLVLSASDRAERAKATVAAEGRAVDERVLEETTCWRSHIGASEACSASRWTRVPERMTRGELVSRDRAAGATSVDSAASRSCCSGAVTRAASSTRRVPEARRPARDIRDAADTTGRPSDIDGAKLARSAVASPAIRGRFGSNDRERSSGRARFAATCSSMNRREAGTPHGGSRHNRSPRRGG